LEGNALWEWPSRAALLDLAAAAMAALWRSSTLAQVLLGIEIEFLFALGAAEVMHLPFVLGSSVRPAAVTVSMSMPHTGSFTAVVLAIIISPSLRDFVAR